MATEIIDEAMRVYGGKQWRFESLAAPRCESKTSASIENPMSISDFLSCCRPLNGLRAATMMLVDVQQDVENCGSAENVAAVCQEQRIESLPAALQFAHALPAHSKVGCIAMEKGHGKLDVIKLVTFQDKMAIRDATKIPAGSAYVPFSRPGPWAVKKAFQSLLDRLPGHHVHWGTVTRWEAQAKNSASSSSTWSPDTDTLLQGVAFINDHAPETDANNEQYTWILLNIREDAESPIAGWPEGKVRIMAQNKSKASNGATLQKGFPLTTFSLKPFLAEKLLPVLYPLFVCYGVVALGWPGVGKTPALIAVILAMGRYHIHRLQEEDAVPGWRRAKSLDNFRHQVANVYEGIFLDDPNRENVSMADLKSFLTVEEEQTTSGRYNDAKLTRNCMRAYASNDLDREDEPLDDSRIFITGEEFMKMTRRLFAGDKQADVLACLKRSVVLLVGQHAVYLRLPNQDPEAPVHRIQVDELHKDLLSEKDKPLYSKYKLGIVEYGPQWEQETQQEVRTISLGMEKFAAGRPEVYIKDANEKIEAELWRARLAQSVRLSDRPEGESSQEEETVLPPPPVIIPNPALRCHRIGQFRYPPAKRLRTKSRPEEAPADGSSADLEALAQAAEMDAVEEWQESTGPDGDDFEADTEAAIFLHEWAGNAVVWHVHIVQYGERHLLTVAGDKKKLCVLLLGRHKQDNIERVYVLVLQQSCHPSSWQHSTGNINIWRSLCHFTGPMWSSHTCNRSALLCFLLPEAFGS